MTIPQQPLEKIRVDLETIQFLKNFNVCLTKFLNNKILINKISHRFLVTTKHLSV
jgi:hypothetical protein